ncbi:MAG: hypothetical protein AAB477_02945 [Patescibacteria group bacterium]
MEFLPHAEASARTLVESIDRVIINPIIFFLFAAAMAYFLYGVVQYLLSPGNEEVKKTSKSHMLWGVVGLFIMVAVFGIEKLILSTLGDNKIKINNNGDFVINGGDVADNDVADNENTNKDLFGENKDVSRDLNAPDLAQVVFDTSPFATYKANALCWNDAIKGKANTEYEALTLAKNDARAKYLKDTGVSKTDEAKLGYPVTFATKVLYNKNDKTYYAWVDTRAPKGTGTMSDCKLDILKPAPVIVQSAFTLDELNLSTTILKSTITDYTKSPFLQKYVASPLCWRPPTGLYDTATTEYQSLQKVKAKARDQYVSSNNLSEATTPINLPTIYGVVTALDKTTKLYYSWIDARGPVAPGKDKDCNLDEVLEPVAESNKQNPIRGTYISDFQYYRVMASGIDPTYIGARSRAIQNALIKIAVLKGVGNTSKIVYTVLPEEKYYPQDSITGMYDYWVVVESPR